MVEKAFGVLQILAQCAKDFIRKRTIEEVFPALANYLRKLQVSINSTNRYYKFMRLFLKLLGHCSTKRLLESCIDA